jgi:O-antigen/teichoic acid export membrane protein
MDEGKQRKIGAALSYLSIIITTLIQLLYTPFLIKMLGQSEYGLYALANSIIGYLTVLDLGFGNAIIVYTSKYKTTNNKEAEKKLHGMFKIIFYAIGLIAMIIGIILYLNVRNIFGSTMTTTELNKTKIMMLILTFNLGISFGLSIYTSIISAYEKFVFQKILAIISTMLKPALMIPLLFLGFKSITMAIVITIVNIVVMLSNYIFCKKELKIHIKYNGFDKILFKTILGYSIWLFIGTIVDKINWSVDNFILGAVSGTIAVSIYSVASQLNSLFVNLSTAISNVLLPKMSKMVAKNANSTELTNEFIKVGRIQYYIIFLMSSGLVLFGKNFIKIWLGSDFIESYYVALILVLPICFPLIQNLGLSIMQAMNKYKFRSITTAIMAIINAIISIFLAKKYGPIGAALGTGISIFVCNTIIMNIYYYKVIKIDIIEFWKNIISMTIKFAIPVLVIIVLLQVIKLNSLLTMIILIPIYVTMFSLICYFIVINNYEKEIINRLIKRKK